MKSHRSFSPAPLLLAFLFSALSGLSGQTSNPQPGSVHPSGPAPQAGNPSPRPGVLRSSAAAAQPSADSAPGAAAPAKANPSSTAFKLNTAPAKPGAPAPAAGAQPGPAPDAKKGGWIQPMVQWIIQYSIWIVAATGSILAGVLVYFFFTSRGQKAVEAEPETIAPPRPAQGDEDEGPRRVLVDRETGKPKDMPQRDESEYALVVDKADLELDTPPGAEAHGEKHAASEESIRACIEKDNFDEAYEQYVHWLRDHAGMIFKPELERRMGKFFIKKGDFDKAAYVLERHISMQPAAAIEPEIYFDLGYIHFKRKTLNKCQRYFKLFAENESDPARRQRARNVLSRLEKVKSLN